MMLYWVACVEEQTGAKRQREIKPVIPEVPSFNEDSAYAYIEKQLSFGFRIPNTAAHDSCASWLIAKLRSYADELIVQKASVKAFDGTVLSIQNIVASFNPAERNRILLCAHRDSRPFADQDIKDRDRHIPAANDGASGVAVLLDIARQLSRQENDKGIDIILFDAEDYGPPRGTDSDMEDPYCLGSQYWAKNFHKAGYSAEYGILLDMVGAYNAVFCMEGTSMRYAPSVVRKVWNTGIRLGYAPYFCFEETAPITDDHYYINKFAGIPCIDIIHYDRNSPHHFPAHWHTQADNMDIIDRKTLKAVGQTLMQVIYE